MTGVQTCALPIFLLCVLIGGDGRIGLHRRNHFFKVAAQHNVGATARHVGGNGDHLAAPSLGHDVGFTLMLFGIEHLVKVITGEKDDYIISYQHDTLPVFGKGKEENERHWTSVIRQGMIAALLEKDIENYGLLKLTPKGVKFLEDPYLIDLYKDQDFEKLGQNEVEEEQQQSAQAYDEKLFELLKVERKRVAKSKGLPPYVIFQDPSLEEMATVYPTTKEELSQINGVGMGKVEKFGNSFLQVIQNYVTENEIETASEVVIKTSGTRSKVKISIIQQIDRKINLEEIAQNLNLEDRIEALSETQCFITIKDHKENFPGRIECRLINPAKTNIGVISKHILEKINKNIQTITA